MIYLKLNEIYLYLHSKISQIVLKIPTGHLNPQCIATQGNPNQYLDQPITQKGRQPIGSNDNGSASYWPPRLFHAPTRTTSSGCFLLHTLGTWNRLTGYQVRCIPWEQAPIFNKGIGFYVDLNSLHWIYMLMNNYKRLSCSLRVFWNTGCTKFLVVSCKY